MARPLTLTDEQILALVGDSLDQTGSSWTLARAADAAGLHPSTLIKRFGSRHGLLVALSRRWIESIPIGATTPHAHSELLNWAASQTIDQVGTALLMARLDMLIEDFHDDELRDLLHKGWTKHSAYLSDLVQRCQDSGEIASHLQAEAIALFLLDSAHGALLRAAVHPVPSEVDPGRALTVILEYLK
ncbi:TetR/AcrR family transcriptional regulator [Paeniglutamicibacter antarcticus]|uniref:TetR/AcrR family transcriptional regulator n=1 Tax=Arthrobacter terrae TaxID=2935737 RepID=A0A931GA92_9MICC|nr:TetR/AcrR family transcriptional regulator [Arthrobacter terrae]MBG0741809.1 TetR/AcrR family transcriptional regulator [Arthrobacter terrae]